MPLRRAAPSHCQRSEALAVTHCTELAVTAAGTATLSVRELMRELTFQVSSCQLWQLLAAAFWRVACDYNLGKPQHRATLFITPSETVRVHVPNARAGPPWSSRRSTSAGTRGAARSASVHVLGAPAGGRGAARGKKSRVSFFEDHRAAPPWQMSIFDQIRCAQCGSALSWQRLAAPWQLPDSPRRCS